MLKFKVIYDYFVYFKINISLTTIFSTPNKMFTVCFNLNSYER